MKINTFYFFLIILYLFNPHSSAQSLEYGLYIQSYPLPNTNYTSMALENGEPIETLGEKITLDFKIWTRNDNVFGNVFRIITDKGENIDLMYSVSKDDKRFPMLVIGKAIHPISKEIIREIWTNATLSIDPENGQITMNFDNSLIKAKVAELKNVQSLRISFGYCPFEGYKLEDVASVNLKDISLTRNNKLIRLWKMALHYENDCYDELAQVPAVGQNSHWIIDQNITWDQIYSKDFDQYTSIAFDPTIGNFYMAMDKQELYVFHSNEKVEDTLKLKGGEYAANYPNQLIYIQQRQQLLSYNLDENLFSAFNPEALSWEPIQKPVKEHDYWNNTVTYNPENGSLVSFGGYGHYHFNNELLINYPYESGRKQRRVNLKKIDPRYAASSVIVDSILYIFGGRGCPSGKQELSPSNYYDLYAVNLSTMETIKLWESLESPEMGEFLPSENMIYDEKKQCFYFFSIQMGGILMKIDTQKPYFESMSLPIQAQMKSQYLYTNLYYSPKQAKLYAAILQTQVNGKTHIDIYKINYPPVPVKSLEQSVTGNDRNGKAGILFILVTTLVILSVIGTGIAMYYLKKRKKANNWTTKMPEEEEREREKSNSSHITIDKPVAVTEPEPHFYNLDKQSICLFGEFRIMDREGNNITTSFTPTLKLLLIILILYTGKKDTKGITGRKMLQLLWFDKSEESAKNNRNVYMSKLRNILENVGDVKINNKNGIWSISFENGTQCDYFEALRLYEGSDDENLEKLLELLLRGMLLPNIEIDWLDEFKNDFSNKTIDLLSRLLKQESISDAFKLKITDTLFQHDYINEEALRAKCRILYRQGKSRLAMRVYDTFCKEYLDSLGSQYKIPLKNIIE